MDSEHIEQLLAKYWNCETSLEEERELREYFNGGDIPPSWKETSELFRYFELRKNGSIDPSFDAGVLKKIRTAPRGRGVRLLYNVARMAAGILVVVVATFLVQQEIRKAHPKEVDTYTDPKLAFEETKKALMMISKGFGHAQRETKKINLFNEAEQEVKGKKRKERKK